MSTKISDTSNDIYTHVLTNLKKLPDRKRLSEKTRLIDEIIEDLNFLKSEIMYSNSGYFVCVNDIGPDDCFTRIHTPLTKCTEKEASDMLDKLSDPSNYSEDYYKEVSEKDFKLYLKLISLKKTRIALRTLIKYESDEDRIFINDYIKNLENKINEVRKELNFWSFDDVSYDIEHIGCGYD